MSDLETAALLATVAAYLRAHNACLDCAQGQPLSGNGRSIQMLTTEPRDCEDCGARFTPHPEIGGSFCARCVPF